MLSLVRCVALGCCNLVRICSSDITEITARHYRPTHQTDNEKISANHFIHYVRRRGEHRFPARYLLRPSRYFHSKIINARPSPVSVTDATTRNATPTSDFRLRTNKPSKKSKPHQLWKNCRETNTVEG